jgi:site-specific recombinase XerD
VNSNVIQFRTEKDRLLERYRVYLFKLKSGKTAEDYLYIVEAFITWLEDRPGVRGSFQPTDVTETAVDMFINRVRKVKSTETGEEIEKPYGVSYKNKMRAAISHFSKWLVGQGLISDNPTSSVQIPPQPLLAPRALTNDQRFILRQLVERQRRDGDLRGEAIFALGYWAGCRVSDVSWLKMVDTHVGPKVGWLKVGFKGGKQREIDLLNQARKPLYEYLESEERKGSPYAGSQFVFISQRDGQLKETGIHYWFRELKKKATKGEHDIIQDITFHDLRHDFAHRCREAGWSLEEIAYYLGHVTKKGMPAITTTVRYTQPSRQDIKDKLKLITG